MLAFQYGSLRRLLTRTYVLPGFGHERMKAKNGIPPRPRRLKRMLFFVHFLLPALERGFSILNPRQMSFKGKKDGELGIFVLGWSAMLPMKVYGKWGNGNEGSHLHKKKVCDIFVRDRYGCVYAGYEDWHDFHDGTMFGTLFLRYIRKGESEAKSRQWEQIVPPFPDFYLNP